MATPYTDDLCAEVDVAGEVVTTTTECKVCDSYFTAITERFVNGNCSGDPVENMILAGELGVCVDNEADDLKVIFRCTDTTASRDLYDTEDCSGEIVNVFDASADSCSTIMGETDGVAFTASTIISDVVCVQGGSSGTDRLSAFALTGILAVVVPAAYLAW